MTSVACSAWFLPTIFLIMLVFGYFVTFSESHGGDKLGEVYSNQLLYTAYHQEVKIKSQHWCNCCYCSVKVITGISDNKSKATLRSKEYLLHCEIYIMPRPSTLTSTLTRPSTLTSTRAHTWVAKFPNKKQQLILNDTRLNTHVH